MNLNILKKGGTKINNPINILLISNSDSRLNASSKELNSYLKNREKRTNLKKVKN